MKHFQTFELLPFVQLLSFGKVQAALTHSKVVFLLLLLVAVGCGSAVRDGPDAAEWPEVTSQTRPWAYWWWMGSAVDRDNLKKLLQEYKKGGLGGLHIIPIYQVRGNESNSIEFLSDEWMEMLGFTVEEAAKLGLGIDMTSGTGWPFGGPHVGPDQAAAIVSIRKAIVEGRDFELQTTTLTRNQDGVQIAAVLAFSADAQFKDLTDLVGDDGWIKWSVPEGNWEVFFVLQKPVGKEVERAAPGGEGYAIDYFSEESLRNYLEPFKRAFSNYPGPLPRAFYNDSYEVEKANWTSDFFSEFQKRRGYDLRPFIATLTGQGSEEQVSRVKSDYRETLSDLLLDEFMVPWVEWAHRTGLKTRNEAHGMPGNLLDLYATADIPETEDFGPYGFPIPGLRTDQTYQPENFGKAEKLLYKLASSAANVSGKPLVSSETCTWLGEHFRVSLSQVKPEIDQLFLGGINHVFYHGIAYSPVEAEWPGWLFYASTNFGPTNPFWMHVRALNDYIGRTQAFLQSGRPDNDILLYLPMHDVWYELEGLEKQFSVHSAAEWLHPFPVYGIAQQLDQEGYSFDYVSDRQLQNASVDSGKIQTAPGTGYKILLVPPTRYLSETTLASLRDLAEKGAVVVFQGALPQDVPGLGNLDSRRQDFGNIIEGLTWSGPDSNGMKTARLGEGHWVVGPDLSRLLAQPGVRKEKLVGHGLQYIRRVIPGGTDYFVANLGSKNVDAWVPLSIATPMVLLIDPLHEKRGIAKLRNTEDGVEVYIQIQPGESRILRALKRQVDGAADWLYRSNPGVPQEVRGTWSISFVEGGPSLPDPVQTDRLISWTDFEGDIYGNFSGAARYEIEFATPEVKADNWILDLGRVAESASISLNGQPLGTAFSLPFQLEIPGNILKDSNLLEIEVTNLAANRIADLDRRGVIWRKFHDINFVSIRYEAFDASGWPPMESGLIGPVRLIPLTAD